MAVWFTSDTHFGHGGAIGRFRRPFASAAEADAAMIARWNEVVAPEDTVWHLGDFAVRQSRARVEQLLATLHGEKNLVTGNNDGPATLEAAGWASIQPFVEVEVEGCRLVLCHYALRTWNGMGKGALNLHGHSHGALKPQTRQTDVGVDVWSFRPIGLEMIRARRTRRRVAAGRSAKTDGQTAPSRSSERARPLTRDFVRGTSRADRAPSLPSDGEGGSSRA